MQTSYTSRDRVNFNNQSIHYCIIIVVCFFAFFINNHIIPADLMESRNLATAQEMIREGNYLTPTMNGELRLEKPPLPTWIAAGIEIISPDNLIAQRCAAGVIATLMVIFLYLLVSRITRNCYMGLIMSLILATSFNVILMARTATWDIYCHSFMLGAIYFFVRAFDTKGAQWGNFIIAGVFMGLSFLSKGPVSFYALLLPFLLSYGIICRPNTKGKVWPLVLMVFICLIISFWWFGYNFLFHREMLLHVADKESTAWVNHNVRPIYYYWKFPAEAGIWALFWVTSIVFFFFRKCRRRFKREYQFFFIWFLLSLIFLSLIPEKKTRYLLPLLIPGAGVIGFYIYYSIQKLASKREKIVFGTNAVVIALILLALPIALYVIFYREGELSLAILIPTALISWTLFAFLISSTFGKSGIHPGRIYSSVILCMMMVTSLCLVPIGKMFINDGRDSIKVLRHNEKVKNLPFYYNNKEELRMELVYEANQTIRPLSISDSLLIRKSVPFVFVSGMSIDSLFADSPVEIDHIDTFDNNWRKQGHKRYNWNLVREVAIIKAK